MNIEDMPLPNHFESPPDDGEVEVLLEWENEELKSYIEMLRNEIRKLRPRED